MVVTPLRGGSLRLRPLEPGDGERLCRLYYRLSPDSLFRRFRSPMPAPRPEMLAGLLDVDHCSREAIAALDGDDIVAVARYSRDRGAGVAEVAVVVADDWQHRASAGCC